MPGPVPNAPSNRDYKPGFAAPMMLKDLKLAMTTAQRNDVSTPLGAQAEALYEMFNRNGGDHLDFSGIIKLLSGDLNAKS